MNIKISKLFFSFLFFFTLNLSAQEKVMVSMNLFEPLPAISFAAFLVNPFLDNTPRILHVIMSPHGKMVIVKGSIQWRKIGEGSFNELLNYTTKPFTSRNFYNDDFTSINGIEIEVSNSNSELLSENVKRGQPTGTYKIVIQVFDINMEFQSEATSELNFLNPAQTLSIIEPKIDDVLDVAGILLKWTDVPGVSEFIVRANTRSSKFESLEEALQKGNPIINNRSVGNRTNVNFREILDRELIGGEEIVVQVQGVIPAPNGATTIYSSIVNFRLNSLGRDVVDKGVKDFEILITTVLDSWKERGEGDSEAYKKLTRLLNDLLSGDISFDDIKVRTEEGKQLTFAEFQEIMEYLKLNPDAITNLSFEEN